MKLALNTKMVEKTKPVVNAKPVSNSKTIVAAKPVVNTKPIITTKPAVTTKPVINTKPAVNQIKPQPQAAKPTPVNKPVIAASTKKVESKPILKKQSASWKLPAEYDRLNLTNDQREKAYAILSRYDGQISKLEGMINSLKSDRQREITTLLSVKQKPSLTNAKTPEVKPTSKIGPTKPAMSNGKVKTQSTKVMNPKRDNQTRVGGSRLEGQVAQQSARQKMTRTPRDRRDRCGLIVKEHCGETKSVSPLCFYTALPCSPGPQTPRSGDFSGFSAV